MTNLFEVPKIKYAEQGSCGTTVVEHLAALVADILTRPGATITQEFVVIDGVQCCTSVTVKFSRPVGAPK